MSAVRFFRKATLPGSLLEDLRWQAAVDRLKRQVATHLFVICPNNSGSTLLKEALAASRRTWNLMREGHAMPGFVGPSTVWTPAPGTPPARWIWASRQGWIDELSSPGAFDWPRTRVAWYAYAYAHDPAATVFVAKAPTFLLCVDELRRHFPDVRFLFVVRNPYAACEGICRRYRLSFPSARWEDGRRVQGGLRLERVAATHIANCLRWQRRNVEGHGDRGVLATYEYICTDPGGAEESVRALVPALDDLDLFARRRVKEYDSPPMDMNAGQIERLDSAQIAAFNQVFRTRRSDLAYFGYDLMDQAGAA